MTIPDPPDPHPDMVVAAAVASRRHLDEIATTPVDIPIIDNEALIAIAPYGRLTDPEEALDLVAVWCTWRRGPLSIGFAKFIPITEFNTLVRFEELLEPAPTDISVFTAGGIAQPPPVEPLAQRAGDLARWWSHGVPRQTTKHLIEDVRHRLRDWDDPNSGVISKELDRLSALLDGRITSQAQRRRIAGSLQALAERLSPESDLP